MSLLGFLGMVNLLNKIPVKGKYAIFAVPLIIAILMTFILLKYVDNRPERQSVQNYIITNKVIVAHFGFPVRVDYIPDGSKVSFKNTGVEGVYYFNVHGVSRTGSIRVLWRKDTTGNVNIIDVEQVFKSGERQSLM